VTYGVNLVNFACLNTLEGAGEEAEEIRQAREEIARGELVTMEENERQPG
jgi:hypothetical protein